MIQAFAITRADTRIVFDTRAPDARAPGTPARIALARELRALGARRVLIVSTPGRAPTARRMAEALGDTCAGVLATAAPHVPIEVARAARSEARRLDAEWIVAVGGGSAIGLAKAVALDQMVRVAAVPTTYAGSEMTDIHGITEGDRKITGRDDRARPRLVVYDPALTLDLPVDVSITSGLNAVAHAVEALYAPDVDPLTCMAAEEAIRLLARGLRALVDAPRDLDTRSELLYAAHLAGTCLASARMGLHHKLCHVLGGSFGLPHAATHAVLLPHVIELNREAAAPAIARVARALGHAGAEEAAGALYDLMAGLMAGVGAPVDLRGLGLERADIDRVAAIATEAPYSNPRRVDRAVIRGLLDDAFHGRRPGAPARAVVPAAPATAAASGPDLPDPHGYLSGFGRAMQSEALPGALPRDQNSPRRAPYGLYTECINGTPFTQRRAENRRTWLYRVRPSVVQSRAEPVAQQRIVGRFDSCITAPDLIRWRPLPLPPADRPTDFVDGLVTLAGAGDPDLRSGLAVHLYAASADMHDRCLCNADGDLLLVPELGALSLRTELGWLRVRPGEIAVIPRGLKVTVTLPEGAGRGFALEIFGTGFRLPERGPIGSNGLADERHFLSPVAAFEDRACPGYEILTKHGGQLFRATMDHAPYDVVAWHGNHVPYKYDLARFNTMGSVSFDHPDPSILTVLTCPLDDHGVNLADVIVFPGRWDVAEHTFRPPYYHRNVATELSGIVALAEPYAGFEQGACFLTPSMTPHGIGADGYRRAIDGDDTPRRLADDSLWIMFETALGLRLTPWALATSNRDDSYHDLWKDFPVTFQPPGI